VIGLRRHPLIDPIFSRNKSGINSCSRGRTSTSYSWSIQEPAAISLYSIDEKNPASAVCCKVLNLLSQVGILPGNSALAEAYRVIVARLVPFLWVLAQNGDAASRTPQGT
jgi:hypothetical protein